MPYDKTQQARIDGGLCKDCGVPRGDTGTSIRCRSCADEAGRRSTIRVTARRIRYDEQGLCVQCGKSRNNDTKLCDRCREKSRESGARTAAARRKRRHDAGLCSECGQGRFLTSGYCRWHYIENIARKYHVAKNERPALLQKLEDQQFRCFYTGRPLHPGVNASVDHLTPRNGDNAAFNSVDNLVWCDTAINSMKSNRSYAEFVDLCRLIVETVNARGEGVRPKRFTVAAPFDESGIPPL